jgi:hypothetical protein
MCDVSGGPLADLWSSSVWIDSCSSTSLVVGTRGWKDGYIGNAQSELPCKLREERRVLVALLGLAVVCDSDVEDGKLKCFYPQ